MINANQLETVARSRNTSELMEKVQVHVNAIEQECLKREQERLKGVLPNLKEIRHALYFPKSDTLMVDFYSKVTEVLKENGYTTSWEEVVGVNEITNQPYVLFTFLKVSW